MYGWAGLVEFFLFNIISPILGIYFWIVIIAAVMTWFSPDPYNPLVRAIYSMTEPVFDWVREHLPVAFGGIDFSPIVVIIAIQFVRAWALPNLFRLLVGGFA